MLLNRNFGPALVKLATQGFAARDHLVAGKYSKQVESWVSGNSYKNSRPQVAEVTR